MTNCFYYDLAFSTSVNTKLWELVFFFLGWKIFSIVDSAFSTAVGKSLAFYFIIFLAWWKFFAPSRHFWPIFYRHTLIALGPPIVNWLFLHFLSPSTIFDIFFIVSTFFIMSGSFLYFQSVCFFGCSLFSISLVFFAIWTFFYHMSTGIHGWNAK